MSLRARVLLMLWSIEGITLFVVILFSVNYLYRHSLENIEERAREAALLLRSAVGESLMLENYPSVDEVARVAFFDLPVLDAIRVVSEEGDILADRQRGHQLLSDKHILISAPIFLGSHCFGVIDVSYSTEDALDDAWEHIMILSAFALFGMACSGLAAWEVTSRFVMAIKAIDAGVQVLAAGDMPDPLAIKAVDSELGNLVTSYNLLIAKLHQRDHYIL